MIDPVDFEVSGQAGKQARNLRVLHVPEASG